MLLPVKVDSKKGLISWNFDELKKELEIQLKKYNGLIVEEDNIPEYEKTKANLNKIATKINDEKIRVKKEYSEPLAKFEKEAKEIIDMVKQASDGLNDQLKVFEEQRRNRKLEFIESYVDVKIEESGYEIDTSLIIDDKWLNKGTSDKQWRAAVDEIFTNIDEDINTFKNGGFDDKELIVGLYLKSLDVTIAMKRYNDFVEAKKTSKVNIQPEQEKPTVKAQRSERANLIEVSFTVVGNKAQLSALSEYLNENLEEWWKNE